MKLTKEVEPRRKTTSSSSNSAALACSSSSGEAARTSRSGERNGPSKVDNKKKADVEHQDIVQQPRVNPRAVNFTCSFELCGIITFLWHWACTMQFHDLDRTVRDVLVFDSTQHCHAKCRKILGHCIGLFNHVDTSAIMFPSSVSTYKICNFLGTFETSCLFPHELILCCLIFEPSWSSDTLDHECCTLSSRWQWIDPRALSSS